MDLKFFGDLVSQLDPAHSSGKSSMTISTKESKTEWVSKDELDRVTAERDALKRRVDELEKHLSPDANTGEK